MKKILPFILIIIFVIGLISGHYIYKSFNVEVKSNDEIKKDLEKQKVIEIKDIETKNNKDDVEQVIDEEKVDNTITPSQDKVPSNNIEKEKANNNSHNQNNNDNQKPVDNNKEVIEETPVINNDPVIEDPPQVDEELERLKKLCPYKTSQSCFNASIDVSLNNTSDSNFKHTACESKAYKGELVGYCMLIYYNDDTWKYYKATD